VMQVIRYGTTLVAASGIAHEQWVGKTPWPLSFIILFMIY
jgi:hypothetical protein